MEKLILPGSIWVVFVEAAPPELVLVGRVGRKIPTGRQQRAHGKIKGKLGVSRI